MMQPVPELDMRPGVLDAPPDVEGVRLAQARRVAIGGGQADQYRLADGIPVSPMVTGSVV